MPLYNLARVLSPTIGGGTLTLGTPVQSFLSFAQAGADDGDVVSYAIEDVISNVLNREVGRGTYHNGATPTLTRSVLLSTNANNPLNLSGNAQVSITALAEDIMGGPIDGGFYN